MFVCIVIVAVMTMQFMSRTELELNVVRDRASLYRENNMGLIENTYTLIIMNKSQAPVSVNIVIRGLRYTSFIGTTDITLGAGELVKPPLTITVNPSKIEQKITPFEFIVETGKLNQRPNELKHQSTFIYR